MPDKQQPSETNFPGGWGCGPRLRLISLSSSPPSAPVPRRIHLEAEPVSPRHGVRIPRPTPSVFGDETRVNRGRGLGKAGFPLEASGVAALGGRVQVNGEFQRMSRERKRVSQCMRVCVCVCVCVCVWIWHRRT